MALEPWQQRIIKEFRDLCDKIDALTIFMLGSLFTTLPEKDQDLLRRQNDAMWDYHNVLLARMARFMIPSSKQHGGTPSA